jgi:hypothetical protein
MYYYVLHVITFTKGIYNYFPHTNHVSSVCNVAAVVCLQFMLHVMLLSMLNMFRIFILAGHVVAQFVEALRYKPVGRGFDSRWCQWNFSLT